MGFHKTISEFLIRRRLGEHFSRVSFLEFRGQVAVGLEHGIKGGLGKLAQSGSTDPD